MLLQHCIKDDLVNHKKAYFIMIHQIWLGHVKLVASRDLTVEAVFTGFQDKARHYNAVNRFHSNELNVNLLLRENVNYVISASFKTVLRVVY